ncbi:hypothetical protein K0M31_004518 [Melipona bicolor]|uniref:Uncharacterized protein n=1 Tax=Melipona bicolor TaxID=60889 RepID=A0AA40FX16_9HYME|nr:hypothetical protein K0M31_004518 [Melipona bicolor]
MPSCCRVPFEDNARLSKWNESREVQPDFISVSIVLRSTIKGNEILLSLSVDSSSSSLLVPLSTIRSAMSIYGSSLSVTIQIDKETQTTVYLSLTGMTIEQSSLGAWNRRFSREEPWHYLGPKVVNCEWPGTQWRLEAVRRRLIVYFSTPSGPEVVLASLERADSWGYVDSSTTSLRHLSAKVAQNICLAPGR